MAGIWAWSRRLPRYVTGDPQVKARVSELLDIFANKIIDSAKGYGRYYFNDDWTVADRKGDSKQCEYGLDLEASWLITEAAQRIGRQNDESIRAASLALVDHALRYGFDSVHGGVFRTGPATEPATNRNPPERIQGALEQFVAKPQNGVVSVEE